MNDEGSSEPIRGVAALAGAVPHLLSYRPDDQSVVVLGLRGNQLGPIAVARPPRDAGPAGLTAQMAAEMGDQIGEVFDQHGVTTTITVGYGPDGPGHAHWVADAMDHSAAADRMVILAVDRGQVFQWDDRAAAWTAGQPLDPAVEWVVRGSAPADSYQDLTAGFQPQAARAWPPLSAEQQRELTALSVADQVGVARDLVRRLAEPGVTPGPADHAWLGALANANNVIVRDSVLGAAVTTPGGTGVLQSALVGAPYGYRDGLTAVTAAALYSTGRSSELVLGLTGRIDPAGPNAALAQLIRAATSANLEPYMFRQAIEQANHDADRILGYHAKRGEQPQTNPGIPNRAVRAPENRPPHKPGAGREPGPGVGR